MNSHILLLSLVVASAAASVTIQQMTPPCSQFSQCNIVASNGCPPDDEDCNEDGSGSGSGSSGFDALDTCMDKDGRLMVLKCPPAKETTTPPTVPTKPPPRPTTAKPVPRTKLPEPGVSSDPIKPGKPGNPDQNTAEKENDDESQDKGWMIGIIVGCVIGSAILGVLAAVIVIKLKFSGEKSGSYQTTERGSTGSAGSTGSTSSQKPLYV